MKTKTDLISELDKYKKMYDNHSEFFAVKRKGLSGEFIETIVYCDPSKILILDQKTIDFVKKEWQEYAFKIYKTLKHNEKEEFEIVAKKFLDFIPFLNAILDYQKNN